MASACDVVVVGAGHNGLVAACYLARSGLDVLVLEQASGIGGMTTTITPFAKAPQHKVNPCALDDFFMRMSNIVSDLHLGDHGYRELEVDPAWVYLHPDGASLALWRDPRKTAEEIRFFSRADAEAFLALARTLDALIDVTQPLLLANGRHPGYRPLARAAVRALRQRRFLGSVGSLLVSSASQAITERFEHEVVRDALAELAGVAPIDTDGSAAGLQLLSFVHRWGVGRPAGGTQALPDALAGALRSVGGSVRTGAAVAEIVITGSRATGVRLISGEVVSARAVVASCDPRLALGRLVPPGTLDQAAQARVEHIPAAAFGAAPVKVDVAFSGRLSLRRHQQRRRDDFDLTVPAALVGGLRAASRSFPQAAAGRIPEDIHMWMCVPTALDPSQAPAGQSVLYLYDPAMPRDPESPWSAQAETVAKSMVATAAEFYDGVAEMEIDRFVETPEDMAARTGASYGAAPFHVDMTLMRLGPLRPALGLGGSRTPVAGLYLGGAGAHPGPGINGVPGRLAAEAVGRDLKRS